jgi:hypothetical protein
LINLFVLLNVLEHHTKFNSYQEQSQAFSSSSSSAFLSSLGLPTGPLLEMTVHAAAETELVSEIDKPHMDDVDEDADDKYELEADDDGAGSKGVDEDVGNK